LDSIGGPSPLLRHRGREVKWWARECSWADRSGRTDLSKGGMHQVKGLARLISWQFLFRAIKWVGVIATPRRGIHTRMPRTASPKGGAG